MSLTPADVHNVAFSKPPIGKRGYNEDEVDAFLDLVETELARLIEENIGLHQQIEQLDTELEKNRNELVAAQNGMPSGRSPSPSPVMEGGRRLAPVPPVSPAEQTHLLGDSGEANLQAARVLGLAQEMADRLTAEAKAESDGMLAEARSKSEQLLSDARLKADSLVNEARTRAESMLNDARSRAETLEKQVREKVTTMERDAARQYKETMATLTSDRDGLTSKIEELRTIEREYRTRLRGFLESQLRELDDRSSAAPTSVANSAQAERGGNGYSFGARAEAS